MACPVVIPLSALSQYTKASIGAVAQGTVQLIQLGVPLPELFVIPRETLARLLRESHLEHSLGKLLSAFHTAPHSERPSLLKHIQQSIEFCTLPEWFTIEIHRAHAQLFTAPFCRIIPAETVHGFDPEVFAQIVGDANCIESFKKAWGSISAHLVQHADRASLATLTQVPFIVEEQMQPVVSGLVQTTPRSSSPSVLVKAIWGTPDATLFETAADTYQVDVRTWQVVQKTAVQKKFRFERSAERKLRTPVSQRYEQFPCLSDEQAIIIAQIGQSIKQKHVFHQRISWELGAIGLWITGTTDEEPAEAERVRTIKTLTKVYISAGNPQKRHMQVTPHSDGIGVLKSEYTYLTFGIHPFHLIKAKKELPLITALAQTIAHYQESMPFKPVLFRSQNCTSSELARLKFSSMFETEEPNPYLGARGAFRLLNENQWLHCELNALRIAADKSQAPLGYLLPFVRHPQELSALIMKIEQAGLLQYRHFSVWLQVNTPENILNLEAYPTHALTGLSINVTSLQALLTGSDPDNPSTAEHYQSDTTALEELLAHLSTAVARLNTLRVHAPLQLNLHIESFDQQLVETAVKLGYHGIVVKPQTAHLAREAVIDAEQRYILKK